MRAICYKNTDSQSLKDTKAIIESFNSTSTNRTSNHTLWNNITIIPNLSLPKSPSLKVSPNLLINKKITPTLLSFLPLTLK